MDKLIFTALNSLGNLRGTQTVTAQNLANQNVPGFRRDMLGEGKSFVLEDAGDLSARAFQLERADASFSDLPGLMNQTGEALDIAIPDKGWFFIQPDSGGPPALTRRGDLHTDPEGKLVNGANEAILDTGLRPITLPPFRDIVIDDLGRISITPLDGAPGERLEVATIATTQAPAYTLRKGEDGQIRPISGPLPAPDQQARVRQGVLEGSNVNPTEELIDQISQQRSFELNMRVISTARELDESGVSLMRMPG